MTTVARVLLRAGMVIGAEWAPLPISALRGVVAALFVGVLSYVVLHLAWTAGGY